MARNYSVADRWTGAGSPVVVDRILVGACAAIWLIVLGVGVAATVVLADRGQGQRGVASTSETPWLLYAVIGISALVIVGAIPLLVRARRTAAVESAPAAPPPTRSASRPVTPQRSGAAAADPVRPPEDSTEKLRVFGRVSDPVERGRIAYPSPREVAAYDGSDPSGEAIARVWLRFTAVFVGAMGVALFGVAVATYLMGAEDNNGISVATWAALGVAGVITLALPAVPWFYLRQMRAAIVS